MDFFNGFLPPPPTIQRPPQKTTSDEHNLDRKKVYAEILEKTRPKHHLAGLPEKVADTTFYKSDPSFDSTSRDNFGFVSILANTTLNRDVTIDDVPERPPAPSPKIITITGSGPQTTITTPPENVNLERCTNMISLKEAEAQIQHLLTKHKIGWWNSGQFVWGPIGKRIKDNIVDLWKSHFTDDKVPLVECPSLTSQLPPPNCPIAFCTKCKFIIDVVEFIRDVTQGEMYDGSSLEQLQRKMKMIKTVCPRCQTEESFSDPMFGFQAVPVALGGTLLGATGENDARVQDPTLYKIAPSSMIQNQVHLKDPMADQAKKTTAVTDKQAESNIADCSTATTATTTTEMTTTTLPFNHVALPTSMSALSSVCDELQIAPPLFDGAAGTAGVAAITPLWKSRIGQLPSDTFLPHTFRPLYTAANVTEACCLMSDVPTTLDYGTRECWIFEKEDQYLKKTRPRKVSVSYLEGLNFTCPSFGYVTNKCLEFLNSLIRFECVTTENIVLREVLPCELHGSKYIGEISSAWNIEARVHNEQKNRLVLGQIFIMSGPVSDNRVGCRFEIETLVYATLLAGMRQDETRSSIWFRPYWHVAPWTALLVVTFPSKIMADTTENAEIVRQIRDHARNYLNSLRLQGISVALFLEQSNISGVAADDGGALAAAESAADDLGIPFLITLDGNACMKDASTFDVSVMLRERDNPRRKTQHSLDTIASTILTRCRC